MAATGSVQVVDPRLVACLGFLVFALVSFMRADFSMQADWMTIALPMFIQGAANVMFFLPLTALGLRSMTPEKMPGATGLQNFLRYMGGAVGASLAITLWEDRAKLHRAQLAEHGHAVAQELGWERSAARHADVYRAALEKTRDSDAREGTAQRYCAITPRTWPR